ncbi:MAG: glycosyltransferase family 2 protein [Myxococcota bacterium]|nr:glycosyltransferase family 2 protein [Myxococcota bacterium]
MAVSSQPDLASASPAETAAEVRLQPFVAGPRFSVLMAAYNRADLIHVAIDSVLAQDFQDYELVIVDDGSTDDTPNVVGRYQDARIRYIRKSHNEGRSPTRNRAISEARGEFVLWMADDDLLSPNLLTLYDGILREEPHIDVIYGKLQLFDHDSGDDLNLFTPNDWTGRDAEIIGAKLYGSCVPDGGTATRRRIYQSVGPGPYDDEFVRAQDYELWTRIVGQARFRFVDEVVYRYRKHSGGTSWGEFIDLTLDSKIIRRHLNRHPIKRLFSSLDWRQDDLALNQAYLRIAKNLQMYGDHLNAHRFLDAIVGHESWPEAILHRGHSYIAMGDLDGVEALINGVPNACGIAHDVQSDLQDIVRTLRGFIDACDDWFGKGQLDAIVRQAAAFDNRYFQTYHTMYFRGRAHDRAGNAEAALHCYCLAGRLNPSDEATDDLVKRLRKTVGETPKTDLTAMRRRLNERLYTIPIRAQSQKNALKLVHVIATGVSGNALDQSLKSVCNQSHTHLKIHLFGAETSVTDDRIVKRSDSESPRDFILQLEDEYIAWIDDKTIWAANHLKHGISVLGDQFDTAAMCGLRKADTDGQSGTIELDTQAHYDPAICFSRNQLPLTHFVHHRSGLADDGLTFRQTADEEWDLALQLILSDKTRFVAAPTVIQIVEHEPKCMSDSVSAGLELLRFFQPYTSQTGFNVRARTAQNALLAPLGFRVSRQGRTSIILHGGRFISEIQDAVRHLRAKTLVPHEFVVMVDPPSFDVAEEINHWANEFDDVRVCEYRAWTGLAKQINDGLARANGEYVAVVHMTTRVPDGWLGRLQGCTTDGRSTVVIPSLSEHTSIGSVDVNQSRSSESMTGHCLLIPRQVIDRIGGLDVTLGAPGFEWLDYHRRLSLAGFDVQIAEDVNVISEFVESAGDEIHQGRFERRWQGVYSETYNRPLHFQKFGSEEGFRPDSRPVLVEEAGKNNLLVMPPWADPDALVEFLSFCSQSERPLTLWMRCPPGTAHQRVNSLTEIISTTAIRQSEQVSILLVDSNLAPERESGLYRAADAVFVNDTWPGISDVIRRSYDCRRRLLRGYLELEEWLASDA